MAKEKWDGTLINLKIALPGGRVVRVKTDFPYEVSPIGFRVLLNGKTGIVVGQSDEAQAETELAFPDKLPLTDKKNLEAVKDTAYIYGISVWQFMWDLVPSEWNWKEEEFLEISLSSFQALDQKTKEILGWIAERKLVKKESVKKRFGREIIDLLVKKGFLKVKKDWTAPDVEIEIFRLKLPFETALSKLKKTKRYPERVKLINYLRERLYASKEELREEGFSSQDLRFLISSGIVEVERELMQNFVVNPKTHLRQSVGALIRRLDRPVLIVGNLPRLTDRLFDLVEEALSQRKGLAIFCFHNPTLIYLLNQLKPIFGDKVISLSAFESSKQFLKNWFLAQEEGRIVLTGRLGLLTPFKNPYAVVLFDDYYTKLKGYIDLRNYLFQLYKYYGCQFFYYTCALGVDTYHKVKNSQWGLENLGYSAEVKFLKRGPEKILTQDLLSELEDDSLLLIRKTGYSYAYCPKCGFLVECPQCRTFLTMSKDSKNLFCTRCKWKGPTECTHCGGSITSYGFGIERIMEELEKYGLVKENLHFDTKPSVSGTYKKVFLVHGDNILSVPSLNAEEEFFKYVCRARAIARDKLYIQSFLEKDLIEEYLEEGFLDRELERRRRENLPPFSKLIFAVFTKERAKALSSIPNIKTRVYGNVLEAFVKVSHKHLREVLPSIHNLKPIKLEVW